MKKLLLTLFTFGVMISASSCGLSRVDPVGTWYCPENNVLLTFYEDQSFDRRMIAFSSPYDGTYQWTIDSKKTLKVSDLTGETIQAFQWDQDETADSTWHLEDNLVFEDHHYMNTEGKKITEKDISPDFLENHANCVCTVSMKEDSPLSFEELQNTLANMEDVQSVEYISPEKAWEMFKNEYFSDDDNFAEGFTDDNPLQNSAHLEIHTYTQDGQNRIVSYLKSLDYVRSISTTASTVKNDSFL